MQTPYPNRVRRFYRYKKTAPKGVRSECLLAGLEGILQADASVEYQMAGCAVAAVGAEVAKSHELIGCGSLGVCQGSFRLAAGEHFQGVGVHACQEIFTCGIGIGIQEQIVILADLGIHSSLGIHPVDGSTLDLTAVSGVAATGLGIVGSQNFHHIAVLIGDTAGALDQVSTLQAAFRSVGEQALVLGHGNCQEVIGFDPQIPGEGDLTGAVFRTG